MLTPVILSGGSGTRLWPLSRELYPKQLLPLVENNNWFFDTELLLLAEHNSLRVSEVAVRWVEDPGTSVKLKSTIIEDMQGLWRVRRAFWHGAGHIKKQRHLHPAAEHR